MKKCASPAFLVLYNKKRLQKTKLCQKKLQSELWTNKQPSLKWCVLCAIQNGNKLQHSNLVTFDAKKVKYFVRTRLSKNICYIQKIHLVKNPIQTTSFSLLWKLAKMPTFMLFSSSSGSEQSSQAGYWLSLTFYAKESTYWGHNGVQSSWNEEGWMNARSWSI